MSAPGVESTHLVSIFQDASKVPKPSKARKTRPFAIRFTDEERSYLKSKAGNRPLGAWCREQLLGARAEKRVELKQPRLDDQQYASLLAALGESRLSSNMNQLARHANMGTLDVSKDVERQLEEAYEAILAMRDALITALEIKLR